jgi:hypothetical protein
VEIASTAGLSVGPHLFGSRIKDSEGNWSVVDIKTIHVDRVPEVAAPSWPLVALEYFIGATDPGVGHGIPIPISTGDSIDIHRALDVSTLAPGSYNVFLRAKDLSGLWNHLTSFQLVIRPANCTMPMANFVSTSSIAGQPTSFINTSSNVLPTASVEWDMNADGITDYVVNNPMHVFGSPGIYEVTLRIDNGNGCVNEKVHLQEVGPLPARQLVLSGPSEFCDCDSLIISAPVGSSYLWNTGDTTASIVAGQSGNYSVVVSDSLGNLIQSQSTQVLVHPQPQISTFVSPSYNGMNNGTASVSAVSGGSGYLYHYVWSTGDSTRSIQGLNPGMYWVAVSDPYCTVYDTVIVQSVIQQPLSGVVMAEYMFGDVDPGPGQAHALEFGYGDDVLRSVSVNTQGLAPGIHNLWIRVKEDSGVWSTWARRPITISDTSILPTLPDADIQQVAYFIDTDNGVMNSNLLISGLQTQYLNASYTLNMPSLSPGLHELAVRVRDNNGNWSTIKTAEINNCVPPASPIAGNDLVACVGSTVQLNSVFSGSEPVYWQGPHGTIYSGTQPSFTATDTSYQGYYLVYAEGAGACKSAFDSVYVSVVRAPENAGNIVLNALAQCVTNDTINLFIQPQNGVVNYQWLLPPGALILAGNNTNSVTIDLSGWNGSSAIIQAVLSNACGQDTSNSFALTRCTNTLPVVATAASYALSADSAFTGGIVVQAGASVLQRVGICISLQSQPDLSDRVIDAPVGLGAFHVYVDNLQAQTQYYVRAFAQNNQGVSYGNELSFITPQVTNGCGVSITSSAFLPGNYRVNLSWNSTGASVYNVWFRIVGDTTWSRVNAQTAFRSLFPMAPGDYEYYISEAGNTNPSCVGNFTVECEDFTYSVNTFQIVDATKGKVNVFGVTGGRRTWDFGLDDGTDTTWLNNGFSRRFLNLDPGTYSIYVKDNFDCYSSQVVTVTIDPIDSSVIPVLTTVQNLGGGSLRPVWTVSDPT